MDLFLCGLANDVVLSLPLGTSALSYLFVSLVAAYVRNATVRSTSLLIGSHLLLQF